MSKVIAQEIKDKAVELYKNGKSFRQVSDALGIHKNTANRYCQVIGCVRNKKNFTTEKDVATRLYKKGHTAEKISEIIPVSRRLINSWMSKENISRSRGPAGEKEATIEYQMRRRVAYRNWRTVIFKRDNYQCQICEQKNKRLHAHHIYSFKHYPTKRHQVANGVTLCVRCHRALHGNNYYGKKLIGQSWYWPIRREASKQTSAKGVAS